MPDINPFGDIERMKNELEEKKVEILVKNIIALRKMAGLTQAEIGKKLGISRQRIISYERGEREMPWIVFLAFVCFFERFEETAIMMQALSITGKELDELITGK